MPRPASPVETSDATEDTYVFEIRSGLYRGARHSLGPGRHVVGSAEGADFLLMEPSLEARHAALVLNGGLLRVEGLAEGVSVEGAGPVPPGSARTVRLPTIVDIGAIRTVWSLEAPAPAAKDPPTTLRAIAADVFAARSRHELAQAFGGLRTRWRRWDVRQHALTVLSHWDLQRDLKHALTALRILLRRPAMPGIAAAAILTATATFTLAGHKRRPVPEGAAQAAPSLASRRDTSSDRQSGGFDNSNTGGTASALAGSRPPASSSAKKAADPGAEAAERPELTPMLATEKTAPASALAPAKATVDKAAEAFAGEVRRAGLLNVHIAGGDKVVTATGSFEPDMAERWEALQEHFDTRFAGEVPLVDSVVKRAEKLPTSLAIESVWRGKNPYIVVRGQRYLIGARVDGGWAIRGIEKDRVVLERDGRLVAIRF